MLPEAVGGSQPEIYFSENYVTLDFETDTSHGDYGHPIHPENGIVLASWKEGPDGPLVSHFGGEFNQEKLLNTIEAADFTICHNAKYELGWLRRCGLDLSNILIYDTKIAEYVLLGNLAAGCNTTGLPPRSTSLEQCCQRRGWKSKDPVIDIMMSQGLNPVDMPRPWLQGRCEDDVKKTHRLFQDQRSLLVDTERLGVLFTRCLLTPVLADMEFQGMYLDAERVEEVYEENRKRLAELDREMDIIAHGINWKAPTQVAEFLYAPIPDGLGFDECRGRDGSPLRTPTGRKKSDKDTIATLKGATKEQKYFLEVRRDIGKVNAALSKSLEFFQGVCTEFGNLFFAVFNQTVTATHRLSSSGHRTYFQLFDATKTVQFQNMARVFKRLFRSRTDGWMMMEVDGSQLEFRVAADLGGPDPQALEDIYNPNFDAHVQSASIMNGIDYDEFLTEYRAGNKQFKNLRTAAKIDTFKPLYGGESGTKKQKKWYKAFKERYKGIADTQDEWVLSVLSKKRLITPWGMRYYWPRVKRGHNGYVNVKRAVSNYPVQALATAEIIPVAITCLWHRLRGRDDVRMVNTVHDSIVLEVHPDAIDYVRQESIKAFGEDVYEYLDKIYDYEFKVPLGCGVTVGTHWSEGKEESYNIWPNGKVEKVE